MHCTLTFTQFSWTTRTHCTNTTTYLLSLDTIQWRSMTLRIQLMYNLLHLCILLCVYTVTHKSGNQLDLIYTRHCSTDHALVTLLHTSDHFLLTLNLNMITDTSHTPPHVTFRRNLHSLSPSRLSAMVSSLLPPLKQLSYIDANSATDTFCSTLMSCFDIFCPLSSRPARTTPSASWLSVALREHRSKLRAAERVWRKSQNPTDLTFYRSFLSDFSANVSTAKRTYYHGKISNSPNSHMLFKTFPSLLSPPRPPPSSTLTADDFATFFINKITNLTEQTCSHTRSSGGAAEFSRLWISSAQNCVFMCFYFLFLPLFLYV